MKDQFHILPRLLMALLVCGLALGPGASPSMAAPARVGTPTLFPSPDERFGFGVLYGIENYDVLPLSAGWYQNWSLAENARHPGGLDATHVVRVSPTGLHLDAAAVQRIAEQDPGALWIVANEPDMAAQDNVTPTQYAIQYREAYFTIKNADPTAQVAPAGIVQPTPLRLGWLSAAWDKYEELFGSSMPADAWNIHNYILQELPGEWGCGMPPGYSNERPATYPFNSHDDLTIFQAHIRAMREWMEDHGQRNKPLIITEWGILFPESTGYDLNRVRNFFLNTTNWMLTASDPELGYPRDENHLVQRWMWYSLDDTNFNDSGNTIAALMDPVTRQMRSMGQVFANRTMPMHRPYVNLVVARAQLQPAGGAALTVNTTQAVTVVATILNRGNAPVTQPFRVVIEDQDGGLVYQTTVNGMPARYGGNVTVQTPWKKPVGTHWRLTVRVDTGNAVNESNETDNEATVEPSANLHIKSLVIGRPGLGATAVQPRTDAWKLQALIQNRSSLDLTGVQVRFWDDDTLLGQQTLPDWAPGAEIPVEMIWAQPSLGTHDLAVEVILPAGVSDPTPEDNRIAANVLVPAQYSYLPAVFGSPAGAASSLHCANRLTNPSFETGDLRGWNATPFTYLMNASCLEGNYCLWMGAVPGVENDVYQEISIEPWASAHLNFAWAVVTAETAAEPRDSLAVEIRSVTGQLLRTVQVISNRDAHPYWYTSDFDLREFTGETIRLHFRATNDAANSTNFFVDKVNLEICEKD